MHYLVINKFKYQAFIGQKFNIITHRNRKKKDR